jgi:hypothetical protein
MARVMCAEVGPGLRSSERTVAVQDVKGVKHFLRVDADFLTPVNGKHYLPIGVVDRDPAHKVALIEFPIEADSGTSRVWVPSASLDEQLGAAS